MQFLHSPSLWLITLLDCWQLLTHLHSRSGLCHKCCDLQRMINGHVVFVSLRKYFLEDSFGGVAIF